MVLLTDIPALVHRSSCPLTRLALFYAYDTDLADVDRLQPLSTVVDLVVDGDVEKGRQAPFIGKLLLEEYFPDLRRLTLGLQPFRRLWDMNVIPLYLDNRRPRPDGPSERRLLVVDPEEAVEFENMWNSDVGRQVKALGVSLREDGFEFL
jgi:hypothetical protein